MQTLKTIIAKVVLNHGASILAALIGLSIIGTHILEESGHTTAAISLGVVAVASFYALTKIEDIKAAVKADTEN